MLTTTHLHLPGVTEKKCIFAGKLNSAGVGYSQSA